MEHFEILDPLGREAVAAIDAGDVLVLERLLAAHPRLVRDRLEYRGEGGEGYFQQPYLLWFVAENPVRNGTLPKNIAQVIRTILKAAQRQGVDSLREQCDGALALVCSGRVARECGAQRELIDVLAEAGADLDGALVPARTALICTVGLRRQHEVTMFPADFGLGTALIWTVGLRLS